MLINYVPSARGSPQGVTLSLDSRQGSYSGITPIMNGYVLFEFESASGNAVVVDVWVTPNGQSQLREPAQLEWDEGETGKKCVEFSDFGPYDAEVGDQGIYDVMATSVARDKAWSLVWMTIYSG